MADLYYPNVLSLLHFDGVNSSTTFTDEKGVVWTAHGAAALSTTQQKFGSASLAPAGGGIVATGAPFAAIGTGDFTIEGWIYQTSSSGYQTVFRTPAPGTAFYITDGQVNWYESGQKCSSATISENAWHHIATTRKAGVVRVFLDGVKSSSDYTGSTADFSSTSFLAAIGINTKSYVEPFSGYIDEFRVTKGVARYTANFTPPSAPFDNTAISISGSVKFGSTPESRKIKILDLSSITLVGSATSDATTGDYSAEISTLSPVYGIAYIDYGMPWVASKAYALNDRAWPYAAPNGHWYLCTQAGTSGGTEPTWPTDGTTVTDGTAIWTDQGLMERPWIEGPYLPS